MVLYPNIIINTLEAICVHFYNPISGIVCVIYFLFFIALSHMVTYVHTPKCKVIHVFNLRMSEIIVCTFSISFFPSVNIVLRQSIRVISVAMVYQFSTAILNFLCNIKLYENTSGYPFSIIGHLGYL